MAALPDWSPSIPTWSAGHKLLLEDTVTKPQTISLNNFIEESDNFPIKFPTETVRCKSLKNHISEETLHRNINSAYPIVHESILELYAEFLIFKTKHGSDIEKAFYKSMNLKQFINRLLLKRAVMFMGRFDKYLLINGKKGSKGWELVGTPKEKDPLVLKDVLSYDEMKLSVFLSVSSYTYFVNIGDRKNFSTVCDDRSKIEDEGVIIGSIGTRLKKDNVMEFQEVVITPSQNQESNGYGSNIEPGSTIHSLFSSFYDEKPLTFNEATDLKNNESRRFTQIDNKGLFDNHMYYKRLAVTFDTLLVEANARAMNAKTTAYIHVVGLGLGVWKISPHQEHLYMDSFYKRIILLGKNLQAVSDICFSYMKANEIGGFKNGEKIPIEGHPLKGITVHIYKREPHVKLDKIHAGKLSFVTYAWDGNALPGNEFWDGKLGSSGDSAAASSTQITEVHNPHINKLLTADNLKVVSADHKVVSFDEYRESVRSKIMKT